MMNIDLRLAADSFEIADLSLSHIRLMNDQRYPWLLLIPRRDEVRELIDLPLEDQQILLQEINIISRMLQAFWQPDKLNIAALGNVVSQLHVHIVGRFQEDEAWPKPVWGSGDAQKYLASDANKLIMRMRKHLEPHI
jgi:diadenosine tetraphosphate (Ap4A) HIT family hydrolase